MRLPGAPWRREAHRDMAMKMPLNFPNKSLLRFRRVSFRGDNPIRLAYRQCRSEGDRHIMGYSIARVAIIPAILAIAIALVWAISLVPGG
jgi:hypothetical protein